MALTSGSSAGSTAGTTPIRAPHTRRVPPVVTTAASRHRRRTGPAEPHAYTIPVVREIPAPPVQGLGSGVW